MKTAACIVATVFFDLAACTNSPNLSSTPSPQAASGEEQPRIGLHYFLPRGKIRMTGTCEKNDCESSFKITTARVIEADRGQRCFLNYSPSIFYDDEFTLETDENGLLKTVNSTSTDQTPAIIEAATDIAVNLAKAAAEMGMLSQAGKPRPFVYTFDPLNDEECAAARNFLKEMNITLHVKWREVPDSKATARGVSGTQTNVSSNGVFYHPPVAVRLQFSIGGTASPETQDSVVHVLPDYRITECLGLRRAALVKQDTQLTFSSGMLNHVKFTRPSQALAAIQIPQKIVAKAAQAIPAIIKIQNEAATRDLKNQTAILQAQRDYLQAQIELRKREAELTTVRHQNSSSNNQTPPGRGSASGSANPESSSAITPSNSAAVQPSPTAGQPQ